MSVVEPGHELTATDRDRDGRCTTVCECGWISEPGVDAEPFLEGREHILSVRGGDGGEGRAPDRSKCEEKIAWTFGVI